MSLVALLAIAMPFASHGGPGGTASEQSITHHVALDCEMTDVDESCSLSATHCISLVQINCNIFFVDIPFAPALFSLASEASDSLPDSIATPPPRS